MMCGCKQGVCPGGCACGCTHTPPTKQEVAIVERMGREIKSLRITVDSLASAIYEATGTVVDGAGDGHQLAMERLADLGELARENSGITREGMILHRLVVTMTLTDRPDDEAELVDVEVFGEPTLLTSLGMLRMAEDTLLHGPDEATS